MAEEFAMQPFDLFKERLVLYRMTPEVPTLGYEVAGRPKQSLAKPIAKARLIVAGCAVAVMVIALVGTLATH
jgi:hypothetical protein